MLCILYLIHSDFHRYIHSDSWWLMWLIVDGCVNSQWWLFMVVCQLWSKKPILAGKPASSNGTCVQRRSVYRTKFTSDWRCPEYRAEHWNPSCSLIEIIEIILYLKLIWMAPFWLRVAHTEVAAWRYWQLPQRAAVHFAIFGRTITGWQQESIFVLVQHDFLQWWYNFHVQPCSLREDQLLRYSISCLETAHPLVGCYAQYWPMTWPLSVALTISHCQA